MPSVLRSVAATAAACGACALGYAQDATAAALADTPPVVGPPRVEPLAVADYPIKPVVFTAVRLDDNFWRPRLETNRTATIPFALRQCEVSGRMNNFARAAAALRGETLEDRTPPGFPFDDTDLYKVIEGTSYALAAHPDPELEATLDALIELISSAQEPDGYLYTARTLAPDAPHPWAGSERWELETDASHELYNLGHLYEAAVAHFQATGKRSLLDVAIKSANLLVRTFGSGSPTIWPGHQITEMALVRLYRATQDERYLRLAKLLLDARGPGSLPRAGEAYNQSHAPVIEQAEAVGHAVRATYMYSGMTDVAALTGDPRHPPALNRIWEDVVTRKLYLTGGIGARREGESFGQPYELPNLTAYNETCASIGKVFWNHRMFLLTGDARFIDVLERTLYNAVLAGVALDGRTFFYPNPLESFGAHERSPWFGCACCPGNIARFLPTVPGHVYAVRSDAVYVNLYVAGTSRFALGDGRTVGITQETGHPWHGEVRLSVAPPEQGGDFALMLRIPGWARGEAVTGGLYRFANTEGAVPTVSVNGEPVPLRLQRGYLTIRRVWVAQDVITLTLPMPVRRVVARPEVEADRGRVALQRGPIVFALEGHDNPGGEVLNITLDDSSGLHAAFRPDLLGGVVAVTGRATRAHRKADGGVRLTEGPFTAIPYATWANRGPAEMLVWLPRDPAVTWIRPLPTLASSSRVSQSAGGNARAANDLAPVASSRDESHLHAHIACAPGEAAAWIEYHFAKPAKVSRVAAYWYDSPYPWRHDHAPQSWRILHHDGGQWKPVETSDTPGTALDTFNRVDFQPVTTRALRLELVPREGSAVGLLEWTVE